MFGSVSRRVSFVEIMAGNKSRSLCPHDCVHDRMFVDTIDVPQLFLEMIPFWLEHPAFRRQLEYDSEYARLMASGKRFRVSFEKLEPMRRFFKRWFGDQAKREVFFVSRRWFLGDQAKREVTV